MSELVLVRLRVRQDITHAREVLRIQRADLRHLRLVIGLDQRLLRGVEVAPELGVSLLDRACALLHRGGIGLEDRVACGASDADEIRFGLLNVSEADHVTLVERAQHVVDLVHSAQAAPADHERHEAHDRERHEELGRRFLLLKPLHSRILQFLPLQGAMHPGGEERPARRNMKGAVRHSPSARRRLRRGMSRL